MKLNNRYYALLCGLTFVSLSCAQQTLEVLEPWVRIPPPGMNMLAGYGEFTNSSNSTIELVSAQSENFKSISFHISEIVDGISKMTKLESVLLRPGETARFEPGGKHLMISTPQYDERPEQVQIEFLSVSGKRYQVNFVFLNSEP
ncbi:MAG: copper chaperone PCu(A)C [Proteobacteria bacterium]|jgi:periplasmic copper chaperone A|nr:copper chaperone PCu(A)C [Pseudomonadota bacterium]